MLTVFIDGFWDEPASVTRLMGFKLQQHTGVSQRNARVAQVTQNLTHVVSDESTMGVVSSVFFLTVSVFEGILY